MKEEPSVHKDFIFQITTVMVVGFILHYFIPPKQSFHIPQAKAGEISSSRSSQDESLSRMPANSLSLEEKAEKARPKNQEIIVRGLRMIRTTQENPEK